MITEENDRIIASLAKIELGFSNIYEHISKRENFSTPIKTFWQAMAKEEQSHAQVFNDIRKKGAEVESFEVEASIELGQIKDFITEVNGMLKTIKNTEFSESQAYTYGATLEADLSEAEFINGIKLNDESMTGRLMLVKNADKKHSMIMINYSRGVK